ncbi:MAG: histidine kinase [Cyanobacteria bacterium P01_G01_bin.49]
MSNSLKEKIIVALQKAKREERARAEDIREIIQSAISQATLEVKEGSLEIGLLVEDTISAVVEAFQEKEEELQEEITATVEGIIEGLSYAKRQAISKTQGEVKQLQAQLDREEEDLQGQIEAVLGEVNETGKNCSTRIQEMIESSIDMIKDSEEFALMQKRYAQLKTKLAIIKANLAGRYGERFEDVKQYLDEAQTWHEKTKIEPEVLSEKIAQQHAEFEIKLGEAATALAKKERQIKHILRDLWKSSIH